MSSSAGGAHGSLIWHMISDTPTRPQGSRCLVPASAPLDPSAIAGPDGRFRMLAIDQRKSLRHAAGRGRAPERGLGPHGLQGGRHPDPVAGRDRHAHRPRLRPGTRSSTADAVGAGCGLIVAVDRLIQEPGAPLTWSELDEAAMTDGLRAAGAVALKFLVVWRPDDPIGPRQAMVRTFLDGCRELGLVSVLEGLIQVPGISDGPAVDAAILAAAREFGPFAPDVYKTHVPTHGLGPAAEIEARSAELSAAIGRPWVVLSAGVPVERFPDAVGAAGAGGASGFLAGRGVWGPSIRAEGLRHRLGHHCPGPTRAVGRHHHDFGPPVVGGGAGPRISDGRPGSSASGARRRAGHRDRHRDDQQQGRGLPGRWHGRGRGQRRAHRGRTRGRVTRSTTLRACGGATR